MTWNITKHATPDYAPQYGIYEGDSGNDFATVKGGESVARLVAAAPEMLNLIKDLATCLQSEVDAEPLGYDLYRQVLTRTTNLINQIEV